MCGIAGILALDQQAPPRRETIQAMCDAIVHRGPDDQGFLLDGPLGMGMRRLSIIDLAGGHQPISNEDGTISVIQNGEIYNFRELRAELEAQGHRFKTNCDTEAIVHLYEQYGTGVASRLRGMYAFAIWDAPRRRLVVARDRLGIKPLYYSTVGGRLSFASELKSLLAAGLDREIDPQAMHDYLSLTYVPAPATIFKAARKLPPGTMLVAENGQVKIERYWQLRYDPAAASRSEGEWVEAIRSGVEDAVRSHLVADVPLGVFLSGGVDSTAVLACMRKFHTGKLETFSVGFEEKSFSEADVARETARHFETDHHEMTVTSDAVTLVPDLMRGFDEPFADSSAIPVLCVSRLARQHVKVALSGEGGDEVFAGYQTYAATKMAGWYRRAIPAAARKLLPRLVSALPVSHRKVSFDYKAKRFVAGATLDPIEAHLSWKMIFNEDAKRALYADPQAVRPTVRLYRDIARTVESRDLLGQLLAIDTHLGLEGDMLVKVDRMTMSTSLEARVPLLDHPLVELAAGIPSSLKLQGLTTKALLKKAMADRLPKAVTQGKKQGFNVPIPLWLLGPLREMVHDVLSPERIRRAGLFRPEAVTALVGAHERRERDASRDVWTLLMFQLWHDGLGATTSLAPPAPLAVRSAS